MFSRFDLDNSSSLSKEEIDIRSVSSFTDAKQEAPALGFAIDMLEAHAGMNFMQLGAGVGLSIVWPLCSWSCDDPGAICRPYFTWYWSVNAHVGWQPVTKKDAQGKKRTFAPTVNVDGALVNKAGVSLVFFYQAKNVPGQAGERTLT